MKKLLSIILSLVIMLTVLPLGLFIIPTMADDTAINNAETEEVTLGGKTYTILKHEKYNAYDTLKSAVADLDINAYSEVDFSKSIWRVRTARWNNYYDSKIYYGPAPYSTYPSFMLGNSKNHWATLQNSMTVVLDTNEYLAVSPYVKDDKSASAIIDLDFIAPKNGKVLIYDVLGAVKAPATNDESPYWAWLKNHNNKVEVSVLLNGEEIWPADETTDNYISDVGDSVDIPDLGEIEVIKGDCLTLRLQEVNNKSTEKLPSRDVVFTDIEVSYVDVVHTYDNDCDTHCNVCGEIRQAPGHVYSSACDTTCNKCGYVRESDKPHTFDEIDLECNLCGEYNFTMSGKTGDCYWGVYDEVLIIYGKGDMANYSYKYVNGFYKTSAPWADLPIAKVIIEDGVTNIGDYAFYYCTDISSVTIGNSVIRVSNYAFYNCTALTSITIPNSVKNIGSYAFSDCENLESLTLGEGITFMDDYAFYYCTSLKSVTIPNSVEGLGYGVFQSSGIASVIIGKGVKDFGDSAFSDCTNFKDVYITDLTAWCDISFNAYDDNPLYYAENLYINGEKVTNLVIPNGVTEIKPYAFYNCDSFESVIIPEGVTTIGASAFYDCDNLKSVIIPNSVATIDSYAFAYCESLKSITLGKGVTNIYRYAFYSNYYVLGEVFYGGSEADRQNIAISYSNYLLTDATWYYNICNFDKHVFSFDCDTTCSLCDWSRTDAKPHVCDNDEDFICNICGDYRFDSRGKTGDCYWYLYKNVLYITGNGGTGNSGIGWNNELWATVITKVIIEDGVTSIGDKAFNYCNSLTSITIPNSVTSIGNVAFWNCTQLKEVYISDLKAWCEIDFKDSPLVNGGILYLNGKEITGSVTLPKGTKQIGNYAFSNCYFLEEIIIPDSVKSIGSYAFASCRSITEVVLPEGVTEIPSNAFFDCRKLQTLVIKGKVTSVGSNAFENDYKLKNVYFAGSERDYILMDISYGNTPLFMVDWVYNYVPPVDETHEHVYGEWIVTKEASNDATGSQYKECECGDKVTMTIPRKIKFAGASLTLESNIAINYKVKPEYFDIDGYEEIYLIVTFNGKDYVVDNPEYNATEDRFIFSFKEVSGHMMTDTAVATIYGIYQGEVFEGNYAEYSAVTYAKTMLPKSATSAKVKKLIVDLVNYGTAAQIYTNHNTDDLANSWLTDEQKALATQELRETVTHQNLKYEVIDNPTVSWRGAGLKLEAAITIRYEIQATDLTDLKAVLVLDGSTFEVPSSEFVPTGTANRYYIYFTGAAASQMSMPVLATICKGDTAVSNTVQYSIESYIHANKNSADDKLSNLLQKMLKYGDSAYNYAYGDKPIHKHSFSAATCTEPAKCSCGVTQGVALGHIWNDATCKAPKTCEICKITEGTTVDHEYTKGVCIYCNEILTINPKTGLKENADYFHETKDDEGNYYLTVFRFVDSSLNVRDEPWGVYTTNSEWDQGEDTIIYNGKTYYSMGYGGPLPSYTLTDEEIIIKYPEEFSEANEEYRLIVNYEYDLLVTYSTGLMFAQGDILDLVE